MGNSQSEGEKALDNTLAAQAGQMRPTPEQITELWDAYDKNKDGILVSFAGSARRAAASLRLARRRRPFRLNLCARMWWQDCRGHPEGQEPLWSRG